MALRLSSGSSRPDNASKKRAEASTPLTLRPIPSYWVKTFENSSFLNSPLFTNIQYRFFPIALCNNIAATVESTPPDNPSTTLSSWILDFKSATVSSTNESGVQSC